jgi:hypothetical protein
MTVLYWQVLWLTARQYDVTSTLSLDTDAPDRKAIAFADLKQISDADRFKPTAASGWDSE